MIVVEPVASVAPADSARPEKLGISVVGMHASRDA